MLLSASGNTAESPQGIFEFDLVTLSTSSIIHIIGTPEMPSNYTTMSAGNLHMFDTASIFVTWGGMLDISSNMQLSSSTMISATAGGFMAMTGISPGLAGGSGGAHGGRGGDYYSSATGGSVDYGNLLGPFDFGSGGTSAAGGGAVHIRAAGTFDLGGVITSNGAAGCGAGAGGSIWIEAGVLTGQGSVIANGGSVSGSNAAQCGSGGGGRIAIYANTSMQEFDRIVQATAGLGGNLASNGQGAPGTIYTASNLGSSLVIDNAGQIGPWGVTLVKPGNVGKFSVDTFTTEVAITMGVITAPIDLTGLCFRYPPICNFL